MDNIVDYSIVCEGGLNDSRNHILLSRQLPGAALNLVNFEPSLNGGYRRVEGYAAYNSTNKEINPTLSEGPVLGINIFNDEVYAQRKNKTVAQYGIYKNSGLSGWTVVTVPFSLFTIDVSRVRTTAFNFGNYDAVCYTDNSNFGYIFNSTAWTQLKSTNTGASYTVAGGDQCIDKPEGSASFKGHLFLFKDGIVCHSAPRKEFDFKVASGAGQIIPGFKVVMIKSWRDRLYVFGKNNIGYIEASGTNFIYKDVTNNLGCIAPDTVIETGGDLVFLSQDGFRPISGTSNLSDVQIETISKSVQNTIRDKCFNSENEMACAVSIKNKSQVRFFFPRQNVEVQNAFGFIYALRDSSQGLTKEWSVLRGFKPSCVTGGRINKEEVILHGDFDGNVFRQDFGTSFDGKNIVATYTTPFIDMGNSLLRKTLRNIFLHFRPEGRTILTAELNYDYDDPKVSNPKSYTINSDVEFLKYGDPVAKYGNINAVYGVSVVPFATSAIQGSCFSVSVTITSSDQNKSYSIQNILFEHTVKGRR